MRKLLFHPEFRIVKMRKQAIGFKYGAFQSEFLMSLGSSQNFVPAPFVVACAALSIPRGGKSPLVPASRSPAQCGWARPSRKFA
jgi:hypothetical protein